jgi:uncharacterized protein YcbK (DUF882 family)
MTKDKVSMHFSRAEFACKCGCGFDAVDVELLAVLEDVRLAFQAEHIGESLVVEITSGCRCPSHNKKAGGATASMHLRAKAADIKLWIGWHINQVPPDEVADYLERPYPGKYGIGRYDAWTHIDVRPDRARWDERSQTKWNPSPS